MHRPTPPRRRRSRACLPQECRRRECIRGRRHPGDEGEETGPLRVLPRTHELPPVVTVVEVSSRGAHAPTDREDGFATDREKGRTSRVAASGADGSTQFVWPLRDSLGPLTNTQGSPPSFAQDLHRFVSCLKTGVQSWSRAAVASCGPPRPATPAPGGRGASGPRPHGRTYGGAPCSTTFPLQDWPKVRVRPYEASRSASSTTGSISPESSMRSSRFSTPANARRES